MKDENKPVDNTALFKKCDFSGFKKVLIRIKPSERFGGIGLFAMRDLEKGMMFAKWELMNENLFFSWDDFEKIDEESKETVLDFCAEAENGFYAPDDINYISLPWHMNHCCDGNVGFNENGDFITIKDVKKGEELFYDYGLVMSNPKYRLDCRCQSENCRKVITGDDWKNIDFQKKNYQYMSPEIKEMIEN